MNHAYKLFAAAVVLVAIVFGSMEVSYRAAQDSPVPEETRPAANAPKPGNVPPPQPAPTLPPGPDPAAATTPVSQFSGTDPDNPYGDAPPESVEGQTPEPMISLPAGDE